MHGMSGYGESCQIIAFKLQNRSLTKPRRHEEKRENRNQDLWGKTLDLILTFVIFVPSCETNDFNFKTVLSRSHEGTKKAGKQKSRSLG
jgi:hypothetical protein